MIATAVADAAVSAAVGRPATVRLGLSRRGVLGGRADRVTLRLRGLEVAGLVLDAVHVDARRAWIAPGWPPRLRTGPVEVAVTVTQAALDDWLLADALPFRLRLREGGLIVRTGAVGIRLAELHAGIAVEDGRVVVVAERADILGVTVPSPPVRIPLPLPPLPGGTTPTSLVVRDGSITIGLRVPRVDEPLTPELLRNLSAATMRQDRRSVLTR
ncbi:MAG TPA: LmeA family phospholipid-binding protein [Acidimicrobiales bacterium]|nr:LmeA family phospholipid-binding protein [Acidimicrobiales bacterium]